MNDAETTLRDRFAEVVLIEFLRTDVVMIASSGDVTIQTIAQSSYRIADAMLAARSTGNPA